MKTQEILPTLNYTLCTYSLSFSSKITSSPFFCFISRDKRKIQTPLLYWNSSNPNDFVIFSLFTITKIL